MVGRRLSKACIQPHGQSLRIKGWQTNQNHLYHVIDKRDYRQWGFDDAGWWAWSNPPSPRGLFLSCIRVEWLFVVLLPSWLQGEQTVVQYLWNGRKKEILGKTDSSHNSKNLLILILTYSQFLRNFIFLWNPFSIVFRFFHSIVYRRNEIVNVDGFYHVHLFVIFINQVNLK